MTVKVEIGFDLTDSPIGPFFRLNDPIAGRLNNTEFTLAGTIFYDVTEYAEAITIRRGKSRLLDKFEAGTLSVVFNNTNRYFDPTYTASPFFGNIVPRREIRISVDSVYQFWGTINDWNLDFQPEGKQTATAIATDGFAILSNQTLSSRTNSAEAAGDRINTILSLDEVDWPLDNRDIDTGAQTLGADLIADDANVLSYLQRVEQSEPGRLFIGKSGDLVFRDRTIAPTSATLVDLADDGSGIPFQILSVQYGSELLYNEIVISSAITSGTAIANNSTSQGEYGVKNYTQTDLLMSTTEAAQEIADYYAGKFGEPEFRFDRIEVKLDELTAGQKSEILDLELGDVVSVLFTPGFAPAISKYAEVIQIENVISPTSHVVRFGFSTLDFSALVLDDLVFGKLDEDALAF